MSGIARDELEVRLTAAFRQGGLPAAPVTLVDALERVPDASPTERRGRGRSSIAALGVAAVIGVAGLLAIVGGGRGPSVPAPSDRPSVAPGVAVSVAIRWTSAVPPSDAVRAELIRIVASRLEDTDAAGSPVRADGPDHLVIDLPAGVDPLSVTGRLCLDGHVGFVPLETQTAQFGDQLDPARFPALFDGTGVVPASMSFETRDALNRPTLTFQLTNEATQVFAAYTESHVGEEFALTIDGRVIAAPRIMAPIPNGNVQIALGTETDNVGALRDAAAVIRSGPLPVDLVDESQPGPSASSPSAIRSVEPTPSVLPSGLDVTCEPPLDIAGPQMTCDAAVATALSLVPAAAGPLGRITFRHECVDVTGRGVALDCAVQMFGLVSIELAHDRTFVVQTSLGSSPAVVNPVGVTIPTLPLRRIGPTESCSEVLAGPVTIRIDPGRAEAVWAEDADGEVGLRVGSTITAETEPFPMILDGGRHPIAHDGSVIDFGARRSGPAICQSILDRAVLILDPAA